MSVIVVGITSRGSNHTFIDKKMERCDGLIM
jgi:hypothetical protein